MSLKEFYKNFKREVEVYRLVLEDKRTPKLGKFFLGIAIGYLFIPFDIIPDFIPVLGHIDDLIIIPSLIFIGINLIPKEIIEEHRNGINKNK